MFNGQSTINNEQWKALIAGFCIDELIDLSYCCGFFVFSANCLLLIDYW
jgi:hypothetical protein